MSTAILGMGVTGQSIARFLRARGELCATFDEQGGKSMTADVQIGPLDAKKLAAFDRVAVSPGISWHHPVLDQLRAAEVRLCSDLDIFLESYQGELLAITGTNGKTSVTHLLGVLLETAAGGVGVGGNIGQPMLDLLSEIHPSPRALLELSSFQLQRCHEAHPKWAALLNIQSDHADMHADPEEYRASKLRLFAHQSEGDTAVLPVGDSFDDLAANLKQRGVRVRRFGYGNHADIGSTDTDLFWQDGAGVRCTVPLAELHLIGSHQQCNLAVAAQAAADCGIHEAVIREGVTSFRGLPHRLQLVSSHGGRDWFDDSKATNPDAAAAAMAALGSVVWVCGGVTKGLDPMVLLDSVRRHVHSMLIIGKKQAPFVALAKASGVPWSKLGTIKKAVLKASQVQDSLLPVLLSPAAASFDQFANYAARGDAFKQAIEALK
ncbi:MAG: UDP-N-acetylmuramoyl-L-alanine--D-glutamate ligase [Mariprofundales bacterium]|nr:UDP-N-acetylmuramoyl-L-alanine--D-glutamate ligase [Mariprofundales bacterium]